jgi:hypothetical protein
MVTEESEVGVGVLDDAGLSRAIRLWKESEKRLAAVPVRLHGIEYLRSVPGTLPEKP